MLRAAALLVALAPAVSAAGPAVTLVHVIRGRTTGALVAVREGTVTVHQDGRETGHSLDTVRELVFAQSREPGLPAPFTVWDRRGNRLSVRRVAAGDAPSTVDLTGYGWTARGVPLGMLRALAARRLLVEGGEALDAFQRAMDDSGRTSDVVVATTERGVQAASCIVTALSGDGVEVSVGGRERTAGWDRCVGIVLSTVGSPGPAGRLHRVTLRDGTTIALDSFAVEDGRLAGRVEAAEYSVDSAKLAAVRVASRSYAYLSDLPVESAESEPQLDVVWPHRMDLAVTGGPLALGAVEYDKGVGMHPRTALAFRNTGGFDRLLAMVGLDDAAGDRGSVRFLVLADGRIVLDTGPLTGTDEPRGIAADVTGARIVTIAVEAGDPFVLSGNLGDWCDARLVRTPPGGPEAGERAPAAR